MNSDHLSVSFYCIIKLLFRSDWTFAAIDAAYKQLDLLFKLFRIVAVVKINPRITDTVALKVIQYKEFQGSRTHSEKLLGRPQYRRKP